VFIKLDFLLFIFHRLQERCRLLRAHLAFLLRFDLGRRRLLVALRFFLARSFDVAG
jgi:hypothetical protein